MVEQPVLRCANDRIAVSAVKVTAQAKRHADFKFHAGMLKTRPGSWKDLVWDNMWGRDAS